jgi:hypothetical protein
MNDVMRHELPEAIVIDPKQNKISSGGRTLTLPQGISIEGDEPKRLILYPGGAFPRISITLKNEKGAKKSITVDPVTAIPRIVGGRRFRLPLLT